MQVPRAPAAHVEPLHCARGTWALLAVQQDQLLEGAHRRVLQHLLQLWGGGWGEKGEARKSLSPVVSSLPLPHLAP